MTKIPPDDILEGLYKLRIRESEKFKTVLEWYNMEIHQKKAGPDYHRLKTMVKRSIEQDLRNRNFGARNGNYERNAVVKNQGTQQREQRSLGYCWQWKSNEQCSIDTVESFSKIFHAAECEKMHRKPEVLEAEVQVGKRLDCRARITSKELAPIHYVKNGTLQSVCSTSQKMDTILGEKCSYVHRQVDEQPNKRSKKNGDENVVAVLKKHEWYDRTTLGLRRSRYGAAEVFFDDGYNSP